MKTNPWIGKHGPLLIAEIGGNHEGDFDYAIKLTHLAVESGADYVKFQIYSGDGLVNPVEDPNRNAHFKRFELTRDQHLQLAGICKEQGVGYTASVWEDDAFDWIDDTIDFYKVGSGDLTAYAYLERISSFGKPILLSTGLAHEAEVLEAVNFIRSQSDFYRRPESIAVLQCTSMYPIPPADANLNVMSRLKELLHCPVGYSDHTEGTDALEVAAAMGAQILEFHFTDSREGKTFRDHKVSLTKDEVRVLIKRLDKLRQLRGSDQKKPLAVEGDHVTSFRRAVYPVHDLDAGHVIKQEDLISLRPANGIPANDHFKLLGRKVNRPVKKFEALSWSYFE